MATTKITDLTAYTDPISTDVVPIVDVTSDVTKKVSIADLMENAGSGSEGAPGISFDGDPNTGIYRPGADQVAISTGGSGRLFIDASGNVTVDTNTFYVDAVNNRVGVGTTSPGRALEIGTSGPAIKFNNGTNAWTIGTGAFIDGSDSFCFFEEGVGERMRIDNSGRVGIGTSSPLVNLQVRNDTTTAYSPGTAPSNTTLVENLDTTTAYTPAISQWNARGSTTTTSMWYAGNAGQNTTYAESAFVIGNRTGASSYAERLRIDGSGRVGIGTTSPAAPLDISNSVPLIRLTDSDGTNTYGQISASTGALSFAHRNGASNGQIIFQGLGGGVTDEYGRFDTSGRLLVGTSTARSVAGVTGGFHLTGTGADSCLNVSRYSANTGPAILQFGKSRGTSDGSYTIVNENDQLGSISFAGADGTDLNSIGATITAFVDGTPGADDMPGRLVFSTTADGSSSPTERMRITGTGLTKFSTTGAYTDIDPLAHGFRSENSGEWLLTNVHAHSSAPYGIVIYYPNAAPNGASNYFLYCYDSSAVRAHIKSNGGLANYQSNDTNLCDEREKKNIEPLDSTWNRLKHWELKKFHYNEDADTDDKRYGVIAQQVEPHCPEVITEWVKQKAKDAVLDDDGNVVTPAVEEVVRMGVKEQQMMWMAIKALQEAQTRIETLEAEVAALKGA